MIAQETGSIMHITVSQLSARQICTKTSLKNSSCRREQRPSWANKRRGMKIATLLECDARTRIDNAYRHISKDMPNGKSHDANITREFITE